MHSSHRSLLVTCRVPERARHRIDAVILPTVRPVENVKVAVDLADTLGCPVLILCSARSHVRAAAGFIGRGAAVMVSPTLPHPFFDLPTMRPSTWLSAPYVDTANKRNVGLLVARMMGWRYVMLLDDDVFDLDPARVAGMASAMTRGRMRAIGWLFESFPDNSVACHARRSAGGVQDVFIGAGALLVDAAGPVPFFPAVYNEDWLFWHDFVLERRLGLAGSASQEPYNPFADPSRAYRQEFGDVLAEGLYSLIHQGRPVLVGCLPGFWPGVIRDRRDMLGAIERRLWSMRKTRSHTPDGFEIPQVITAVEASLSALAGITADDLAGYTSQWRFDLFRWRARLHQVPRFDRVREALGWLGVTDAHVVGDV
jgi:hypothetical protein